MAIASPALRARNFSEFATQVSITRSRTRNRVAICIILCSMLAGGCARNPTEPEFDPALQKVADAPDSTTSCPHRYSQRDRAEPRVCRPDPALLAPQPAPDCEFKRADLKTVDSDEWARLKIEYERQCYKNAETIARERLSSLQASSTCKIEPIRQSKPARSESAQPK